MAWKEEKNVAGGDPEENREFSPNDSGEPGTRKKDKQSWGKQPEKIGDIIWGRWRKFLNKHQRRSDRDRKRNKKMLPDNSFGD